MENINNPNFDIKKSFTEANNIIIRAHSRAGNSQTPSMKYYLASKQATEIYFYDGIEVLFKDGYKYDSNSNLQILNDDNKVIQEIKNEKHFHLKDKDLNQKNDPDLDFFIKLPFPKPINLEEFNKKHNNPKVVVETQLKDNSIYELMKKQFKAIEYDAKETYDRLFGEKEQEDGNLEK